MKNKFDSCLSVTTTWTDSNNKTIQNKMKVKGQTITFRTTFRVETKEVFDKLLGMKKGDYEKFKESKILTNALLKIQREKCKGKLTDFDFSIFKKRGKKKVMVGRK